jgi:hypothetical protein
MRILLVALLLAGCSMADLSGHKGTNLEEQKGNRKIVLAEQACADTGLVINTPAYDKCLDEALKDDPQLKAQLARLKAQFAKRVADGTVAADSHCEGFGYYRGSVEYNICLEYARENNIGGAAKTKSGK